MKRTLGPLALVVALLTGCGGGEESPTAEQPRAEPTASALSSAYDVCSDQLDAALEPYQEDRDPPSVDDVLRIDDDGMSMIVTTAEPGGEILSAVALATAVCVLGETDAPSTVAANMGNTTALMGRQSADYDDLKVEWSYAAGYDAAGFQATFEEQ